MTRHLVTAGGAPESQRQREPSLVLLDELWRRQPQLALINLLLGIIVVIVLLPVVGWEPVRFWAALLLISQALRLHDWRLARQWPPELRDRRLPPWRLALVSGATGMAWGVLALLLIGTPEPTVRVFVPFVIAGMAAGSITVLSACPPAYAAFLACALGPYAIQQSFQPGPEADWLALITALYGVGLVLVGRHLHAGQQRLAALYGRNGRLVAALTMARAALEERVRARSEELEEANAVLAEEVRRRRHGEQHAREQALIDPLTGLPNRTLFLDRLTVALARARRKGGRVAVVLIDVDRFKLINDGLGHLAGDDVLRKLARRLVNTIRASDTLGRFGGDEFIALFGDLRTVDDALTATDHLHAAAAATCDENPLPADISLSVGIAVYPDHGEAPEELLGGADIALYQAKVRGRARTEMLGDAQVEAIRARRQNAVAWREAVLRGDVEVVCARRRRSGGQRVAAVAVSAVDRQIGPGIGLSETARSSGYLREFETAVLRRAVTAAGRTRGPALAVAISRATLVATGFEAELLELLARHQLAPHRLELALPEDAWTDQLDDNPDPVIGRLRAAGIRFLLDAFGSGAASLDVLRGAPVDGVRLAPELVSGATSAKLANALLTSVLSVAAARKLNVVLARVDAWPLTLAARTGECFVEDNAELSLRAAFAAVEEVNELRA